MGRMAIRTQAWGTVTNRNGDALANLTFDLKNTDGSPATHWSAETGGSSSTATLLTDDDGGATLSGVDRFIDSGEYVLTVNGKTYTVYTTGGGSTGAAGPPGPPGVAGNFRGIYASGTTYAIGDVVDDGAGTLFISNINSNTGNAPDTHNTGDGSGTQWSPYIAPSVVTDSSATPKKIDSTGVVAGGVPTYDAASGKFLAGGLITPQALAFVWTDGQSIAANQSNVPLDLPDGNYEARFATSPVLPIQDATHSDGLISPAAGIFMCVVNFTFSLVAPIGAFPIVVTSTLYTTDSAAHIGDIANSAPRTIDVTTLRAGVAGDRFSHSHTYYDRLDPNDGVWVGITTGSTPILIDGAASGNLMGIELGYVGTYNVSQA